ncbi:MAG: LruC domain-containing protein [Bacteroidia bacterium]
MKKYILILSIAASLVSCRKTLENQVDNGNKTPQEFVTDINDMIVPDGFDYKTTRNVDFKVQLLTNNDQPLKGIRVDFMDKSPEDGGIIYLTGISDANGYVEVSKELPTSVTEVIINTDFLGLPNNLIGTIQGGKLNANIGGSAPQRLVTADTRKNYPIAPLGKNASKFSRKLGTWDNNGRPNYLMPSRDNISQSFLNDVNVSLPERRPVPQFNPEYLASNKERNLILKEMCDVWVTFVAEGAGYQNSLMFFVYNKNNKPTNISQIDSFYHIFPNASFSGSGGSMVSGDKVYIGRFGADTCIGFAIAANGWNGSNRTVGMGLNLYTTIKELNPESNPAKAEHVVLLYDNPTERFLIGFEDLVRSNGGSDEDFNDAIVYATANPVKAVEKENCVPTTQAKDTDGDSVDDEFDEYPSDPARAYNVYYPNQNTFATVAFEDLWPSKGDYDLNDVVVDFQYQAVTDAANRTKDIKAKYKLRAAGGVFRNGFSVEMPFNVSEVASVTGNGLGIEEGSTKAILKVFSNSKAIISGYNTNVGVKYTETDTINSTITLTNSKNITLGNFNPFIYVDEPGKGRGYEVHLTGQTPTSLVNSAILGTNSDATTPSKGIYYKTRNNLPFAIAIPERFAYPWEKTQIVLAHLRFASWAQSGGSSYTDWYQSKSGYRDATKIYVKP